MKIPSNVPVFIQAIEDQENERYTKAKLKVFYIGETPDHRVFSKEFSDKLIPTLPSTPVVAFYSEEDEDFKGHNKVQYSYGHVPENAQIYYEKDKESGNTFAVTDIILYTEREDNIGEVAKKIIGKQHSLELKTESLKYKINRDNKGKFKNIEFTDGEFIGLSVLGDNESPAFTGSEFFTEKDNMNNFLNYLNKNGGTIEVFEIGEFSAKMSDFFAKTVQEVQTDIYTTLNDMGVYGWIAENTDNYAVIFQCSPDNKYEYKKYSIVKGEDGKMSLENPVVVYARYITEEQINSLDSAQSNFSINNAAEITPKKDDDDDKDDNDDDNDDKEDPKKDDDDMDDVGDAAKDDKKGKCSEDNNQAGENFGTSAVSNNKEGEDDGAANEPEKKEKEDKMGNATSSVSNATLSDSERIELEGYRKAAKLQVINEFKEDLTDDILNKYSEKVDEYTKEQLELLLSHEFRIFVKNNKNKEKEEVKKSVTVFERFNNIGGNDYNENDPASVINKYKKS